MTAAVKPEYFVVLLMLPPAIAGAYLARNRGRNPYFWGLISAIFPIFLMVVYFEKPLREVRGGFKRCTSCGEYVKWQATTCKYCSEDLTSPPPFPEA